MEKSPQRKTAQRCLENRAENALPNVGSNGKVLQPGTCNHSLFQARSQFFAILPKAELPDS
jgi:hypothetical protein